MLQWILRMAGTILLEDRAYERLYDAGLLAEEAPIN
jgi:hypothetical protein